MEALQRMTDEPVLRLDRSRYFSSVHGERTPDDPMYHARNCQDHIYFDAKDIVVPDDGHREPWSKMIGNELKHYGPLYSEAVAAQIIAKTERLRAAAPAPDGTFSEAAVKTVSTNPKETEAAAEEVDLANWLRGREQHQWHVLQAAASIRGVRIHSKKALVEFLVSDGALPISEVAPEYQAYLKQDA